LLTGDEVLLVRERGLAYAHLTRGLPTSIIKAFQEPLVLSPHDEEHDPGKRDGCRMRVHAGLGFFVLVTTMKVATAFSSPPESNHATHRIAGEWIGERDGELVSWNFGDEGKAYLNGRNAVFTVAHDTLRVTFEAPLRAAADVLPEMAVYRFLASDPSMGPSRLFVYGFDLGKQGVWLQPAPEEPTLPEDTAPAAPDVAPHTAPDTAPASPGMPGTRQAAATSPKPPRP